MIAKNLINAEVPPLKISDSGTKALNWMAEFHLRELPVINDRQFVGMLNEYDVLDMEDPSLSVETVFPKGRSPLFSLAYEHLYEVVRKMQDRQQQSLAVVDEEGEYLGVITQDSVLSFLAGTNAFQDPGAVLVLELKSRDYSMAEIARHVEENNAAILASYIYEEEDRLTVTLKLNVNELNAIVATFERFDYKVKASYRDDEEPDLLKERFDALLNYLNI
ncbi:CBS domain-containing protein [Chitinophagales bacterium]|nr:CBS domain-containing protein [Chitinophagales bacterium]